MTLLHQLNPSNMFEVHRISANDMTIKGEVYQTESAINMALWILREAGIDILNIKVLMEKIDDARI